MRGSGHLSEMDAIEVCDGYVRRKGHLSNRGWLMKWAHNYSTRRMRQVSAEWGRGTYPVNQKWRADFFVRNFRTHKYLRRARWLSATAYVRWIKLKLRPKAVGHILINSMGTNGAKWLHSVCELCVCFPTVASYGPIVWIRYFKTCVGRVGYISEKI